jgi:hypothetical protein
MLPACSPDELARLERETKARVGEIEGAAAWDVAFTMLCGHSRASRRYLEWHTPERVFTTSYPGEHGTDLDEGWLARVDVPAVGGYAWDTRVDWTNGRLGFGFKSDELCYGSFELRRVAGAWLLVQVGDACD